VVTLLKPMEGDWEAWVPSEYKKADTHR